VRRLVWHEWRSDISVSFTRNRIYEWARTYLISSHEGFRQPEFYGSSVPRRVASVHSLLAAQIAKTMTRTRDAEEDTA